MKRTTVSLPAVECKLTQLSIDPQLQPSAVVILHEQMLTVDPFYLCVIVNSPAEPTFTMVFANHDAANTFYRRMMDVKPFEEWLNDANEE